MARVNNSEVKRNCEIHTSVKYSFVICRVMGFFPVCGLLKPSNDDLRYTWKSLYTVYYIGTVIGQITICIFGALHFFLMELTLSNTSNLLFCGMGIISTVLLSKLAQEWPGFILELSRIENSLPPDLNYRTYRQCNLITFIFLVLAFVEHLLSVLFNLTFVTYCPIRDSVFESYYVYTSPSVFDHTEFSIWKAILVEITTIQVTFLWTFIDVIIVLFSIYIKKFFDELNKYIKRNKRKETTSWDSIRFQYSLLVKMVNAVDGRLSFIILISFFTNLFYICLQLFNSLNHSYTGIYSNCDEDIVESVVNGVQHRVYYTFSFLFLVVRAYTVSVTAANVNSAAHWPQFALCEVPPQAYNLEVQRFHRQVIYTTVALSGYNFFYVTRKMILKIVGTIVTYELVMLQFRSAPEDPDDLLNINITTFTTLNPN